MRKPQFEEEPIIRSVFLAHPSEKVFADIGAGGRWSNTEFLEPEWSGVRLDKEYGDFVTAENVNDLIPGNAEFLSIDIDGNDYWIWKEIRINPLLVCIEFNPTKEKGVEDYDPNFVWDGGIKYGASKLSLIELAAAKGYVLIAQTGDNLFFLRK